MTRLAVVMATIGVAAALAPSAPVRAQSVVVQRLDADAGERVRDGLTEALRHEGLDVVESGDADGEIDGRVTRRGVLLRIRTRGGEAQDEVRLAGRRATHLAAAASRVGRWLRAQGSPEAERSPRAERATPRPEQRRRGQREAERAELATPGSPWQEAPRVLEVRSGIALFSRRLTLVNDVALRYSEYEVVGAPRVRTSVLWFPLRHVSAEPWAHVGLHLDAHTAFALDSRSTRRESIPTESNGWSIEGRYELPIEQHWVAGFFGYGVERFLVDDEPYRPDGAQRSQLPLAYEHLRAGLAGSVRPASWLRFELELAWRFLLSTGGFDAQNGLPPSDGGGFDVGIAVAVPVTWWLELALRGEYHRYFFAFYPQPGDVYVLGGAMDEWASLTLDVSITLPGSTP